MDLNPSKTKNGVTKAKNIESDDSECEGSDITLHESSTSLLDEADSDFDNMDMNIDQIPENIKDNSFILVQFAKKKSLVYYVGKIISHYSRTEFQVSYLRKKPGSSWTFVFPNVEDMHTVDITDIEMILPDPKLPSVQTPRTAKLFTFAVNLSYFNVQ